MTETFKQLSLKKELLANLKDLAYNSMTPIQAAALPMIQENLDVIAQAKTGSGKTAAFGLAILNNLEVATIKPQSLILCPTRELAEQVAKEIRRLARTLKNVKVLTICGGMAERHQEKSLAHGAHILVGTPGRVLRLLKKELLNFDSISSFVLDEADRMLDMGFQEDIVNITSNLPINRQTMLFSATYPDEIVELSKNIQQEAIVIKVDLEHEENVIDQFFYEVQDHKAKENSLLKILGYYQPERSIVFCKTKQITNYVAKFLNKNGIFAAAIHGDLLQNERTKVLTKFSNGSLSVLVATDVAARGLDIQELAAIVNYDLPFDPEVYVHRIGRTGRAGKTGMAFSMFVPENSHRLKQIEEFTQKEFRISNLPELSSENIYNLTPPMKTIYISGGKKNKLRPGDILGAIVGEANVNSNDIGNISIFDILSYVAIKNEHIDHVIKKLKNGKIKNRKFKVGLA